MTETIVHGGGGSRTAQALAARRSELREQRRALDGGRAALRAELALVTLAARADLLASARILRTSTGAWVQGGAGVRARLPEVLGPAAYRMRAEVTARAVEQAHAAVRRVAGGLLGPEPLPAALLPVAPPWDRAAGVPGVRAPGTPWRDGPAPEPGLPEPPRRVGWAEAVLRSGGGGAVRVAMVVAAGAPALGLTVAGGRLLLPSAIGLAVAAVVWLAAHRRAAAERERWARWVDVALDTTAAAVRADLDRAVIVAEQRAGPALDRIAADRRAAVVAELRTLGGPDGT